MNEKQRVLDEYISSGRRDAALADHRHRMQAKAEERRAYRKRIREEITAEDAADRARQQRFDEAMKAARTAYKAACDASVPNLQEIAAVASKGLLPAEEIA
jgi:hypothetical protein